MAGWIWPAELAPNGKRSGVISQPAGKGICCKTARGRVFAKDEESQIRSFCDIFAPGLAVVAGFCLRSTLAKYGLVNHIKVAASISGNKLAVHKKIHRRL